MPRPDGRLSMAKRVGQLQGNPTNGTYYNNQSHVSLWLLGGTNRVRGRSI